MHLQFKGCEKQCWNKKWLSTRGLFDVLFFRFQFRDSSHSQLQGSSVGTMCTLSMLEDPHILLCLHAQPTTGLTWFKWSWSPYSLCRLLFPTVLRLICLLGRHMFLGRLLCAKSARLWSYIWFHGCPPTSIYIVEHTSETICFVGM